MAKETCLFAKEACISVKEAGISLKEAELCVSDVVARKEPVCCSVLQCVAVSQMSSLARSQYVAVCCSVL